MPEEQKVGSRRIGTAIRHRGWDGEKRREWGHVEQPQAVDGSPSQSRGMGKAPPGPQPSGSLAVPRWPNASCLPERSLVRATHGKGPTVTWLSDCGWRGTWHPPKIPGSLLAEIPSLEMRPYHFEDACYANVFHRRVGEMVGIPSFGVGSLQANYRPCVMNAFDRRAFYFTTVITPWST